MKAFGLNYRRIRSNLDNVEKFSKTVEYIPIKASFEAADTDLLKLLIEPLYGDIPGVGVRELLQNSLDAVRELKEYEINNAIDKKDLPDLEGDIIISIDKDEGGDGYWFKIEDKGIGMNLEVVTQYFLKAGASFRRSDLWKRNFEDREGKSRVLRSGRFGIGVLAAYLLGDEIYVSTKYVKEDIGIEFITKLDEESIELKKIKRPIGTTIKIRMTKKATDELLDLEKDDGKDVWDWYCLNDIKVIRKVNNKKLEQKYSVPELHSRLSDGWYRIENPQFLDIHWTYLIGKAPMLTCNGIIIGSPSERPGFYYQMTSFDFLFVPKLSIFDPDSNLPLTLQRNEISTNKFPFNDELLNEVIQDFIAFILLNLPKVFKPKWFKEPPYRGFGGDISGWIILKNGITMSYDPWFILFGKIKQLITIFIKDIKDIDRQIIKSDNVGINYIQDIIDDQYDIASVLLRLKLLTSENIFQSYKILINKVIYDNDLSKLKFKPYGFKLEEMYEFKNSLKLEFKDNYWYIFSLGNCPDEKILEDYARKNQRKTRFGKSPGIIMISFNPEQKKESKSKLAELWEKYLGDPIIPFDINERKEKFSEAYKKLDKYIKTHEAFIKKDHKDELEASLL